MCNWGSEIFTSILMRSFYRIHDSTRNKYLLSNIYVNSIYIILSLVAIETNERYLNTIVYTVLFSI